jgi:hypothetical protein
MVTQKMCGKRREQKEVLNGDQGNATCATDSQTSTMLHALWLPKITIRQGHVANEVAVGWYWALGKGRRCLGERDGTGQGLSMGVGRTNGHELCC